MALKSFHLHLLSSVILATLSTISFGQNFQWAKQIGSAGWDEGGSVKTDQNNNVYTVGIFRGTVDFDPGPSVFNLTSVGESDAFVCKLDAAGNFLWAKQYGDSASIDGESDLVIDASGNLCITNSFLGAVDFDPGAGVFTLISVGSDRDIFVQKLDANGNFIWAKQIGAPYFPAFPTPAHSNAIAVDAGGNLYLTGYFDGVADFDPDPVSTYSMASQFGGTDVFICKLNTDGNFVWAKQFTGTQSYGGVGYGIAVDGAGNVYSTGVLGGTLDVDPGPGVFNLTNSVPFQTEIFLSKLDAQGNFLWAKGMGPGEGTAVVVDGNDNVYSCGWTAAGYPPVISKHSPAGNLLWGKELAGLGGKSIVLDSDGNVYTTGLCFGTNDFDPGPGVFNLTGGNSDSYISKLDSSGNFVWAGLLTGTHQVWANSLAIDLNNDLYATGYFNGTADFDPSPSVFNLSGPLIGGYDIFISKLSANIVVGLAQNDFEENIKIYPNPTAGNLTVEFDREYDGLNMVLKNMLGQTINTNCIIAERRTEIQINEPSGIYLLEISDREAHKAVLKIIKH